MSDSNKKLLTDILDVVTQILEVLNNRASPPSETFNPSSSKKVRKGKKKKYHAKKLGKLVKKISKDPTYMSLGSRHIIQKIHDEHS